MKRIEIVKRGMKWNVVKKFLIKAVQEISEDEFEAEEDKSFNEKKLKSQQKITSHFLPSSSRSSIKKYKPNNVKQKAFHKTLGEWVVSSLRPFIIVEDVKFREHGYNYESPNQSYFS